MASTFSGKAGRRAAIHQSAILSNGLRQAHDTIDQGRTAATGHLNRNEGIFDNAHDMASRLLNAAYDRADDAAARSARHWQPFHDSGVAANDAYADATGLNGAAGRTRATRAFQAGPGYEFARDQGLDAIQRSAAARGGLASGNTTAELMRYANGLAAQAYDSWLDRFNPLIENGLQAAQGRALSDQLLAQLASARGTGQAGLEQALGDRLAGINAALAGLESEAAGSKAGLAYQGAKDVGEAEARGMMAGQEAARNRWNAISGVASQLLGLAKAFL